MVSTKDLMGDPNDKVEVIGSAAINHETLSVAPLSAIPLAALPPAARSAVITTELADVRYWVDGANPTPTQGHLVKFGGVIILNATSQLGNFRVISTGGTATLQISYF